MLCFITSRKVKMQWKCKKEDCAVLGEGAVTDPMCQTGLQSLTMETSQWMMMLHSQVDQLKLTAIKLRQ